MSACVCVVAGRKKREAFCRGGGARTRSRGTALPPSVRPVPPLSLPFPLSLIPPPSLTRRDLLAPGRARRRRGRRGGPARRGAGQARPPRRRRWVGPGRRGGRLLLAGGGRHRGGEAKEGCFYAERMCRCGHALVPSGRWRVWGTVSGGGGRGGAQSAAVAPTPESGASCFSQHAGARISAQGL